MTNLSKRIPHVTPSPSLNVALFYQDIARTPNRNARLARVRSLERVPWLRGTPWLGSNEKRRLREERSERQRRGRGEAEESGVWQAHLTIPKKKLQPRSRPEGSGAFEYASYLVSSLVTSDGKLRLRKQQNKHRSITSKAVVPCLRKVGRAADQTLFLGAEGLKKENPSQPSSRNNSRKPVSKCSRMSVLQKPNKSQIAKDGGLEQSSLVS